MTTTTSNPWADMTTDDLRHVLTANTLSEDSRDVINDELARRSAS